MPLSDGAKSGFDDKPLARGRRSSQGRFSGSKIDFLADVGVPWGPMGRPTSSIDPKLDTDLDISNLGFDRISSHKRGGPRGPGPELPYSSFGAEFAYSPFQVGGMAEPFNPPAPSGPPGC